MFKQNLFICSRQDGGARRRGAGRARHDDDAADHRARHQREPQAAVQARPRLRILCNLALCCMALCLCLMSHDQAKKFFRKVWVCRPIGRPTSSRGWSVGDEIKMRPGPQISSGLG